VFVPSFHEIYFNINFFSRMTTAVIDPTNLMLAITDQTGFVLKTFSDAQTDPDAFRFSNFATDCPSATTSPTRTRRTAASSTTTIIWFNQFRPTARPFCQMGTARNVPDFSAAKMMFAFRGKVCATDR
jgi:hypothetical protein